MSVELPHENIYGHLNRVRWFERNLRREDAILELGCGTGNRITLPLLAWGYDVRGIDIDEASIEYGRRRFAAQGLNPELLRNCALADVEATFDVIIVSEVLEHLDDAAGTALLAEIRAKLNPGGRLLVTVPNGYGWFELESFIWHRTGVGFLLTYSGIAPLIRRVRIPFAGGPTFGTVPSSLSSAPHVQRFTLSEIKRRVGNAGFDVTDATGSVLACGPFTDMLFTGFSRVMALNTRLGARLPRFAAGFYVAASARPTTTADRRAEADRARANTEF